LELELGAFLDGVAMTAVLAALKQILEQPRRRPFEAPAFPREAEITRRLEHPGVVPVYGLGKF
jgi:hypothetical protein